MWFVGKSLRVHCTTFLRDLRHTRKKSLKNNTRRACTLLHVSLAFIHAHCPCPAGTNTSAGCSACKVYRCTCNSQFITSRNILYIVISCISSSPFPLNTPATVNTRTQPIDVADLALPFSMVACCRIPSANTSWASNEGRTYSV